MSTIVRILAGLFALVLAGLVARRVHHERRVARIRTALKARREEGKTFHAAMVSDLPEPVQRYFLHAIEPGTPLASQVTLRMTGSISTDKGKSWMPLTAEQVLAPWQGFVWKARVDSGPLFLSGADYYHEGEGRVHFDLLGLFPVVDAGGPDVSLSALGRMVIETMWLPSALLSSVDVRWAAVDERHLQATVTVDGEPLQLNFAIGPLGQVLRADILRWGSGPENNSSFRYLPFRATVDEEGAFGGYTIPVRLRVGWTYETDGYVESIRLQVHEAHFR